MESWLRKLVVMLVALAAMILLAPLTASAHEGHHGRSALSAHSETAKVLEMAGMRSPARSAAQSIEDHQVPDHEGACKDGCCFGMGCCGATIVSEVPSLDPPAGHTKPYPHAGPPLFSARLTALLEPPKTLA